MPRSSILHSNSCWKVLVNNVISPSLPYSGNWELREFVKFIVEKGQVNAKQFQGGKKNDFIVNV